MCIYFRYVPTDPSAGKVPAANATFFAKLPPAQLKEWVGTTFGAAAARGAGTGDGAFEAGMASLRDGTQVIQICYMYTCRYIYSYR